jgi:hypothetical protein
LGAGEKQQSIQQDTQQQQVQSQQTDGVAPTVQQAEGGTRATVEETTAEQLGQNLRGQTASPSLAAGGAVTAAAAAATSSITIQSSASSNLNNDVKASGSATNSSPKQPPKASPAKMPQESLQPSKDDKYTGVKGILKVKHCANYHNITTPKPSEKVKSASPDGKRHLFPAYEGKNNDKKVDDNRKITWIPMARVLTIPSRKDIPLSQKAQVSRGQYESILSCIVDYFRFDSISLTNLLLCTSTSILSGMVAKIRLRRLQKNWPHHLQSHGMRWIRNMAHQHQRLGQGSTISCVCLPTRSQEAEYRR